MELSLVEQSGVLDCDDGLRRKIADELDLLVGKGANLLAVNTDDAYSSSSLSIGTTTRVRASGNSAVATRIGSRSA
jgi:hypothetical protein